VSFCEGRIIRDLEAELLNEGEACLEITRFRGAARKDFKEIILLICTW
jgi:hypothetical protein